MTDIQKTRLRIAVKSAAIAGLALIVYIGGFSIFGSGIPCVFRSVTGYLCPGCGMTHAFSAILNGNFVQALNDNVLSLTLVPAGLLYLLFREVRYVKTGFDSYKVWERVFLFLCAAGMIFYFLIRNRLI